MRKNEEDIFSKIYLLLKKEKSFYLVSLIYGSVVSLLYLAVPISVQTLITTITFGGMIQPLLVVSFLLLTLLLLAGFFKSLQVYTIEKFQRHFYARLTSVMSVKLLGSSWNSTKERLSADLASRYYDIMTVQKKMSLLVTDFSSLILQIFFGLLLLAFYHPYFIVFDLVFIFSTYLVWKIFASKAIHSAILESKAKYNTGNWMFELARQKEVFQSRRFSTFALDELDQRINIYLDSREKHFKTFFAQTISILFIYAFMSAFILSLGGYLVIEEQLTVGQLVAAELIVTIILNSVSKSSKHFESFYDLCAAVDKLHVFYELEEIVSTEESRQFGESLEFKISDLKLDGNEVLSLHVKAEEKININFSRLSFRKKFFNLLQKREHLLSGKIDIGVKSLNFISESEAKEMMYFCDGLSVFHGTVRENLGFNNSENDSEIFSILEIVDLDEAVRELEAGLDTYLFPDGAPLWQSQLYRLEVAKAILSDSPILIVGDNLLFIEKSRQEKITKYLAGLDKTIIYTDLGKELESLEVMSTVSYGDIV
jgi:putative ABC transport system ATP-binding protein